jgi:hypothetical protein
MTRRTPTLIHRGFLYAQARVERYFNEHPDAFTARRMSHAAAWRAGYLAAQNDRKRRSPPPCR